MISTKKTVAGAAAPGSSHNQAVSAASAGRVVTRPVPQSQARDARGYQIEQLRRRFSPKVTEAADGTTSLVFTITPSDPDFPFDLAGLECELQVPSGYPKAHPQLSVRNKDIPRGFGINIEKGWDRLVEEKRGATLLALTNALDKNLEAFLTEQKAETVKLTIIKNAKQPDEPLSSVANEAEAATTTQKAPEPRKPYIPEASFTKEQIADAKARRAQEVRQLEARMGRLPVYHKSSDGIIYTLPLDPRRRSDLPLGLQKVQTFQLIIPLLYPLQALRVLLNEVDSSDADRVEELFMEKAAEQRQMSLTSHVNYLAANLHTLAKQAQVQKVAAPAVDTVAVEVHEKNAELTATSDGAKSHVKVIPRPPEWHTDHGEDSQDDDSYDSDTDDSGGAAITAGADPSASSTKPPASTSAATQPVERGTALSFPSIQLHGIELLQISVLNLSVKCERCKTVNEVLGLKDGIEKRESCKKCATAFTARFRPEMVHQNSIRAGFIDATGCTVADMLPSTFIPTCASCSTLSHGLLSVRGENTTNVCRECHARFNFALPETKFQTYIPGSGVLPPTTGPRRRMEKLGLHAGEPLPDRGACAHYRRSYRWFRFACCERVFPCDKCHDEATVAAGPGGGSGDGHVSEWAHRMICGYCSREQNYRPEDCAFCGRSVIGRRGTGFWEGGKGTRSKVLMRRGDKRKYRRVGGGEAKKPVD